MTAEEQASTSSTPTVLSKPWPAVAKLGQRIVRELGITNDVDTLGRWISHRVAELIERAEQATTDADRELARRECADLIIRLWEHRSERSYARPLAHIREFLEKFTLERSSKRAYIARCAATHRTDSGA